jgi:hypothetical protein
MNEAKIFFDNVKDLIKAIGTSSSVDQERDERSVENHVRQSANTNTTNSQTGGNTMSNTTEPDPKGDIAVQKDLPADNQPASTDLVNQETRPVDGVSVADAPNQITDVSTGGAGIYKSGMTCPDCNEAVMHMCNMDKADKSEEEDKVEKADVCADCGKSTADCGCTKKSVSEKEDEESSEDDEAVEKAASVEEDSRVSKVWKGAFSPFNKL